MVIVVIMLIIVLVVIMLIKKRLGRVGFPPFKNLNVIGSKNFIFSTIIDNSENTRQVLVSSMFSESKLDLVAKKSRKLK